MFKSSLALLGSAVLPMFVAPVSSVADEGCFALPSLRSQVVHDLHCDHHCDLHCEPIEYPLCPPGEIGQATWPIEFDLSSGCQFPIEIAADPVISAPIERTELRSFTRDVPYTVYVPETTFREETYSVQVPSTETTQVPYQVTLEDGSTETRVRPETRTVFRSETRTRQVAVTQMRAEIKYRTETYQKNVPVGSVGDGDISGSPPSGQDIAFDCQNAMGINVRVLASVLKPILKEEFGAEPNQKMITVDAIEFEVSERGTRYTVVATVDEENPTQVAVKVSAFGASSQELTQRAASITIELEAGTNPSQASSRKSKRPSYMVASHHLSRRWNDSSGKRSVVATLIKSISSTHVILRRESDGREFMTPLSSLSSSDLDHLASVKSARPVH